MIVFILFFLSGAASLVLETVFRRQLALYVGSAVTATSLTLATFLGGLALGAAIFGRAADRTARPLRLYAALELGVGIAGGTAVAMLSYGREALLAPVRLAGAGSAGAIVAAFITALLLLPSTILMGGTLPALTRHALGLGGTLLGRLASLYAVNTLGASLGAAAAGFLLFEMLGVSGTGWLGASAAMAVGLAALLVDRRTTAIEPVSAVRAAAAARNRTQAIALVVTAVGGAVALGYEVVWTRLLVLPLRSYAYSFSLMLSLFLLGLVVGAAALRRLEPRIERPLEALALVQLASAAYVAANLPWLPAVLAPPSGGTGFGAFLASGILRAGPVVIPPTMFSGMALPLAVRVFSSGREGAGTAVGTVYAANTIGAISGALGAGLVLLPAIGASRSLAVLATAGASAGLLAALAARPGRAKAWTSVLVAAACAVAVFLSPAPFVEAYARAGRSRAGSAPPLFYREGATDTVAVVPREYGFRDSEAKSVIVNGIAMTATVRPIWRYMAAEGHLPALFAHAPADALVLCVGTGITLGALASHEAVKAIDAIDLSESVIAALPVFDRENRAAYRDPKVRILHADGRHALELSGKRYGLITLEPPPPIVAGSVHLYTLDFYRLCRQHLSPGGVIAQWLPLHAQSLASAQATARTFLDAFPYAQLWLPSVRDAVLIGSDRPLRLDPERLRAAYGAPATRASLDAAYFETPEALLGTYLLDRDGVESWAAGADVITDDRPSIEFFRRYGRAMGDSEIATILDRKPGAIELLLGASPDPALRAAVDAERRAHLLYVRAEIDRDPARSREAALASRATRFGLYRLGCDGWQLDALRSGPGGDEPWRKQAAMCEDLLAASKSLTGSTRRAAPSAPPGERPPS